MENEKKVHLGKKVAILTLSLIGFITTIKLAMIYYNANFNPYALPSFCSVDEFIDCDGIAKTTESQFFGIPLAYWGMFLYFVMSILLFADKLKNFKLFKFMEVFKNPLDYVASLGLVSFTISMVLLCVSLFEIKKLCVLCAFTYILNLLIALIAIDWKNGHIAKAFKNSIRDFLDAIKITPYKIAFIICATLACGFLAYTTTSYVFTPQVKRQNDFQEFVSATTNKYSAKGKITGWPGGYASWGDHRVWLEPAKETNTFGRDKFSIHGGVAFGSAGCIDLRTEISDFIKWFEQNKKDVILHVKY